jgi:hypothetical protein
MRDFDTPKKGRWHGILLGLTGEELLMFSLIRSYDSFGCPPKLRSLHY